MHDYLLACSRLLVLLILVTLFYDAMFPADHSCERRVNSQERYVLRLLCLPLSSSHLPPITTHTTSSHLNSSYDYQYLMTNMTRMEKCLAAQPLLMRDIYPRLTTECEWNVLGNEACTRRPPPDLWLYYLLVGLALTIISALPDQILQYVVKQCTKRPQLEDLGVRSR